MLYFDVKCVKLYNTKVFHFDFSNKKFFPNIQFEENPTEFLCLTYSVKTAGYHKQTVVPVKYQLKEPICLNKTTVNFGGDCKTTVSKVSIFTYNKILLLIYKTGSNKSLHRHLGVLFKCKNNSLPFTRSTHTVMYGLTRTVKKCIQVDCTVCCIYYIHSGTNAIGIFIKLEACDM